MPEHADDERSLGERCFNAALRVATIIHLETMAADGLSGDLRDFLDDHSEFFSDLLGVDLETESDIEEWVVSNHLKGWVIEAETPVVGPDGRFSWGHCYLRTFYGKTYDEAINQALDWAEHNDGSGDVA